MQFLQKCICVNRETRDYESRRVVLWVRVNRFVQNFEMRQSCEASQGEVLFKASEGICLTLAPPRQHYHQRARPRIVHSRRRMEIGLSLSNSQRQRLSDGVHRVRHELARRRLRSLPKRVTYDAQHVGVVFSLAVGQDSRPRAAPALWLHHVEGGRHGSQPPSRTAWFVVWRMVLRDVVYKRSCPATLHPQLEEGFGGGV